MNESFIQDSIKILEIKSFMENSLELMMWSWGDDSISLESLPFSLILLFIFISLWIMDQILMLFVVMRDLWIHFQEASFELWPKSHQKSWQKALEHLFIGSRNS